MQYWREDPLEPHGCCPINVVPYIDVMLVCRYPDGSAPFVNPSLWSCFVGKSGAPDARSSVVRRWFVLCRRAPVPLD